MIQIRVLSLLFLFAITGCQKSTDEQNAPVSQSPVLATVNSQSITEKDVDFMIQRTFSDAENALVNDETRRNVLQSLIASKSMQTVMLQELSVEKLTDIENKAKAYQEELYVKEYLLKNAKPKPISSKAIQSYYERNIANFGGGESITIELLKSASKPSESQRDAILKAIAKLKADTNWAEFVSTNNELGLQHFRSVVQPGLFEPVIEQSIKPLKVGDSSGVIFVKQVPHIIKVINKQKNVAKPLASVSASIRKELAAIELKKAIKKASDDVVQKVDVQIK